ncbi:MAG: SRPBCC family protein [Sciscionella sp.]
MARIEPGYYRFCSEWLLPARPTAVYRTVVDLASYPDWWPDVRAVSKVDEDTAELRCRAVLPYSLQLRMHRREQDEHSGRLRVELSGDLIGLLAGDISAVPQGTRLVIIQEVIVAKRILRLLDPVARPVFRANHAMMMRHGHEGLRRRLRVTAAP